MQTRIRTLSVFLTIIALLIATGTRASIISFTPTGTSTVPQSGNLDWDMFSGSTSTSSAFGPYEFQLSDHGDIHFNSTFADMINLGTDTGGVDLAIGTLIGPSSNWSNTFNYVGTTGFGGGCSIVNTCIYGLSLEISGSTHYGWVQFTEDSSTQSLLGWAYEDVPGQAIAAGSTGSSVPEPAMLWLFTFGISGIGFSRQIRNMQRRNS